MRRRVLKTVRLLAVFLLLGAIVNAAVAWGCSVTLIEATLSGRQFADQQVSGYSWSHIILHRFGAERLISVRRSLSADQWWPIRGSQHLPELLDPLPDWCTFGLVKLRTDPAPAFPMLVQEASGWPCRCLRSTGSIVHSSDKQHGIFICDGIVIDGFVVFGPGLSIHQTRTGTDPWLEKAYLPLLPMWPGVALNMLFYSAILFALIRGPFLLRRAIRHRRGLCAACGYDLGGHGNGRAPGATVCPECGASS